MPWAAQHVHRGSYVLCFIALLLPPRATAKPPVIIGINDSRIGKSSALAGFAHQLGIRDLVLAVPWHPGQTAPSGDPFRAAAPGTRIVAVIYGEGNDAPKSADDVAAFCSFAAAVVRGHPGVIAVQVWNEPDYPIFRVPRMRYLSMLQACYPPLHALGVKVLAPGLGPNGAVRAWTKAIRAFTIATVTRFPLFDGWAYHPYWNFRPSHTAQLIARLEEGFRGLPTPTPKRGLRLWWTETGSESAIDDPAKRALYVGEPINWALAMTLQEQAARVGLMVRLARCTPYVVAEYNFLLVDDARLGWDSSRRTAGWQSGLLYPDLTPKPALSSFLKAARHPARSFRGRSSCLPQPESSVRSRID